MSIRSNPHDRPEFEFVDPATESLHYLEHGFPDPRVRWHYHKEFELHLIRASTGKVFVGDHIGDFGPGQLVLVGSRLPHNWISTGALADCVELRDMVLQFEYETIAGAAALIPELRGLLPLLDEASRGIEFVGLGKCAEASMAAVRDSRGPQRLAHFLHFLHELSVWPKRRVLSTIRIESSGDATAQDKINTVVDHVLAHYPEEITLQQMAAKVGMNPSYFSRFFRKTTGNNFIDFLNQIRIGRACELLTNSDRQITNICYEVGYNNVANFNRRFRERKRVTPRQYRFEAQQRLTRGGVRGTTAAE